jgi:flavin-dependent dehydrogenase
MTTPGYDAIVAGARCAGAATAMLLARAGLRVLLADRATFPSDIPHGHFIRRHGPVRLERWGLLEPILATGCPPIETWTTDFGDGTVVATGIAADGVPSAIGPRRSTLDALLVDAAAAAGVELRQHWCIEDVVRDGDRVVGVRGRDTSTGAVANEHAAVTVGADGRRSRVAELVGAELREHVPAMTCWYFSYWTGIASAGLELYQRDAAALFGFPTNDGLFALFAGLPASRLGEMRADPAANIDRLIAAVPSLADRMSHARRAERVFGATDLPNFRRRAAGPGWALVGDAACHKDPYLALGICDAFRDAELLARAIEDACAGRQPMDAALAGYDDARDAATRADFAENMRRATLAPAPPAMLRMRAALRADAGEARLFHLAVEGRIAPERFFEVDHLRALVGDDVPAAPLAAFAAGEAGRVRAAEPFLMRA